MPLAGAVACLQLFAKCFRNSLLLACHFGKYSTDLFSVTVPGGGRPQGFHGYLLLMLKHCPAPPTL